MARVNNGVAKIWVRSFATSQVCNQLNAEEIDVCVDEEDHHKDANVVVQEKYITADTLQTSENENDKPTEVSQLFEYDIGLKEEYKQLLVNAVVERIMRSMPEDEMWQEIEKETGYNHKMVWKEMRDGVMKKIMRLLPANDLLKNIPTEMQLSISDWMLFDLILVHEDINVLHIDSTTEPSDQLLISQGNPKSNKEEPQCLQELFELVKQYDVENLAGQALIEAWMRLTSQYNSRGRACSPMMLQRRWYQMKKLTRSRFYNTYTHDANQDIQKTLQSTVVIELTVLQIAIAVEYNNIIAHECPSWETLIAENRIILSKQFPTTKLLSHENIISSVQAPEPSNDPPALLIERNDNQIDDFDKIKQAEENSAETSDTIIIDMQHNEKYVTALQKVMHTSTEAMQEVENVKESEKCEKNLVEKVSSQEIKESEMCELNLVEKVASQEIIPLWQTLRSEKEEFVDRKMLIEIQDTTLKKLEYMLAADDLLKNLRPSMSPTNAEWSLFDFVIVHETLPALNNNYLDAKCLTVLFDLVVEYQVEDLIGHDLAEAWINLTLKYNRGGRLCSPMLLQLRWHQLKDFTRQHVYNPSTLARNKNRMLITIATKYQKIITQKWLPWSTLIKKKLVILPEQFISILKQGKWKDVEAKEGWYLNLKEETSNSNLNTSVPEDKFDVILEQTPKAIPNQSTSTKVIEKEICEIIDLDSDEEVNEILSEKANEILKEKVNNTLNAPTKIITGDTSKNCEDEGLIMHKPINESTRNDEIILCDSDDEMDKLLQEKANLMSIELPENLKKINKTIGEEVDAFKKIKNSKLCEMVVEEVGIINKETVNTVNPNEGLDEPDFDDNNIEFVDDGIEFEEGRECERDNVESPIVSSSDTEDESDTNESIDNSKIDMKLLMDTTVCTKKIDCLEVFKFIEYDSLRDKRLIDHVETECRLRSKTAPESVDVNSCGQIISDDEGHSDPFDDEEILIPDTEKIKYTSWLLQKPRKRKYKSGQLSTNPDFNVKLKPLTIGFLTSMRNRDLLKECQPVTIDLHKSFEKKLVNGKMYLKRSNFKSSKATEMENCKNHVTAPSIPDMLTNDQSMKLAEHVRDLIAAMTDDSQDESDSMSNTSKLAVRRNKVINLPDKDQIRLINQNLLTAEITPTHQPLLNIDIIAKINNDNESAGILTSLGESPNKRLKTEVETNRPVYCCWAREKIVSKQENLTCAEHKCLANCCTCCCQPELAAMLISNNLNRRPPNTPVTFVPFLPKILNKAHVQNNKINNNFAYSINGVTEIINNIVKNQVNNTKPSSETENSHNNVGNVQKVTITKQKESTNLNKDKNSAKKKVFNMDHKFNTESMIIRKDNVMRKTDHVPVAKPSTSHGLKKGNTPVPPLVKIAPRLPVSPPKSAAATYVMLPPGVNLVKLEDEQIALAINPGVKLAPKELNSLLSLCATMNEASGITNMPAKTPVVPPLVYNRKMI